MNVETQVPANAAAGGDPAVTPAAAVTTPPVPVSVPAPKGGMSVADLERRFAAGRQARQSGSPLETTATKPVAAESAAADTATPAAPATAGGEEEEAASSPQDITPDSVSAEAATEPVETPADSTADPEPSPDGADAKEPSRKLAKRFNNLVGIVKEKDAQIAALQAELAQAKTPTPNPNPKPAETGPLPTDPVSWRPEVQQLDAEIAQAQSVLRWASANPEGGFETVDGKEREFSAEQVRNIRDGVVQELARLNARRELTVQRLTETVQTARAQSVDVALNAYPWIKNPESAQMKELATINASLPKPVLAALNALPEGPLLAADLIAGRMARIQAATRPASKPAPRPTPQPTASAAAPVRVNPGQQKVAEVESAVKSRGRMTVDQLAQRSAAKRQSAQAA